MSEISRATTEQSVAGNRHAGIYQTAVALFHRKGYHATTIRDIAASVGIQTSTFYYYYASKESLLFDIMRSFLTDLTAGVRDVLEKVGPNPVDRLFSAVKFHTQFHGSRSLEALVTDTEVRALAGEYRDRVIDWRDAYEEIFREILADGRARNMMTVADVKVATYAILGMATSIVTWYRSGGRLSLDEIAEIHANIVIQGMVTK